MRVRIPRYTSNRKVPGAMRNTAEVGLPSHDRKPWMKEVYHETSFCMHCRLRALRFAGTRRLRLECPGIVERSEPRKAPPPRWRANRLTSRRAHRDQGDDHGCRWKHHELHRPDTGSRCDGTCRARGNRCRSHHREQPVRHIHHRHQRHHGPRAIRVGSTRSTASRSWKPSTSAPWLPVIPWSSPSSRCSARACAPMPSRHIILR